MSRWVDASPEVRERVPFRLLQEFIETLGDAELRCTVCGKDMAAESDDAVTVQLLVDPEDEGVHKLVPAHRLCALSSVQYVPGLRAELATLAGDEVDVRWCPVRLPSGDFAVAWEASRRVLESDDVSMDETLDPVFSSYLATGFQLVTPADLDAETLPDLPLLSDWHVSLTSAGEMRIVRADGTSALEVELDETTQQAFSGVDQRRRWLVVLTGSHLHLDSDHREAGLYYAATKGYLAGGRVPLR
ncbi:MAG: hypothetical protein ACRD0Z_10080 [Acidimicrobiales bacterium]